MKAIVYGRVSTNKQEYSIDAQRPRMLDYCRFKRFEVLEGYYDVDVSGSMPLRVRPEGSKLWARLSEVDAIVFDKVDRAFRDQVDCLQTVRDLQARKISVHFLDLGVDTTTAAGEAYLGMMAVMARFEWRRTSERIRSALGVAKGQGKKIGPAPIGFRNAAVLGADGRKVNGGVHIADPEEQKTVRKIRELSARGFKPSQIAYLLERDRVPTKRGGKWTHVQVGKVLNR